MSEGGGSLSGAAPGLTATADRGLSECISVQVPTVRVSRVPPLALSRGSFFGAGPAFGLSAKLVMAHIHEPGCVRFTDVSVVRDVDEQVFIGMHLLHRSKVLLP